MAVLHRAQSDITDKARTETVSFLVALPVPAAVIVIYPNFKHVYARDWLSPNASTNIDEDDFKACEVTQQERSMHMIALKGCADWQQN
jgi:hypothetical protein